MSSEQSSPSNVLPTNMPIPEHVVDEHVSSATHESDLDDTQFAASITSLLDGEHDT